MPANVTAAFKRTTEALFGDPVKEAVEAALCPKNVFEVWNRTAVKFPELYRFATSSKQARATEEKLTLLLKTDKVGLASLFAERMVSDGSDNIEDALANWWKEVSA